jgi:mono/diheme cytochrome c family protein
MTMHRLTIHVAVLGLGIGIAAGPAAAQQPAKLSASAAHGRQLWSAIGCYQCHGYQGQGSASGPKLAPQPLPFDAFANQLRKPRDRMPIYTAKVVSEADLNDMYAYLQTIPKAKAVADIPLLNQ